MFIDTVSLDLNGPVTSVCHRICRTPRKTPSIRDAGTAVGTGSAEHSVFVFGKYYLSWTGRGSVCPGETTNVVGRTSDRSEYARWIPLLGCAESFLEQDSSEAGLSL